MENFGRKLRELRIQEGLTQKELAEKIGSVQSAVHYWELDKQEPSISNLKRICEVFEISADYLLDIEGKYSKF